MSGIACLLQHQQHPPRIRLGSNPNNLQPPTSYGPLLGRDERPFNKDIKEQTWNHATSKAGAKIGIISSVMLIEREAKDAYADNAVASLQGNVFLDIMVKDACFFLQSVLFSFGCQLGYPPEHLVFGQNRDKNRLRRWLESMFVVGNQIPLVVLQKLMGQSFFELALMESITHWKKPVGLLDKVLYEFLLVPPLNNHQHGAPTLPCDLLHGMYLMVLGPRNDQDEENGREFHINMGSAVDNADNVMRFPSAKELSKLGIRFKGVDGMGSRGISFTPGMLKGTLCVPLLVVDDSTELLFVNLQDYEEAQEFRNREVGSYLWFMNGLVRTIEDAKILESQGVIKGKIKKLPVILASASRDIGPSRNLYDTMLQINEFSRPRFQKLKTCVKYSFSGVVLVGAVFQVLQYFKK